ncbi:hypothetical protein V5O48_015900, partial [Marasmius crinis-equi]
GVLPASGILGSRNRGPCRYAVEQNRCGIPACRLGARNDVRWGEGAFTRGGGGGSEGAVWRGTGTVDGAGKV